MPIVDIYGHEKLRERLGKSAASGKLPASILLHGPRGAGKQRLALWLAQTLLCDRASAPCGECQSCRYFLELGHPDFHWIFPRPRLKDSDPDLDEVREDYADAIRERAENHGLYAAPSGSEGIFISGVRTMVRDAALTPAKSKRKVFLVGDADRMVAQEGADAAANAFLKLLEEPPADTTVILTSSEPGALLPTIRSRVVPVRVTSIADADVKAFVEDPVVKELLDKSDKSSAAERVRKANGLPGFLLEGEHDAKSVIAAKRILDAALTSQAATPYLVAMSQGAANARGAFSDTLEALVTLLGERMREALHSGDLRAASAASRASEFALQAKQHASGNVNPQLITSRLLRELSATLQ
ncbi:MAG: AAA family ATPase [Gemmatimonadaceae bacterium]|nr:AAA family ATPase [Gemmatimonadaceae bacterium]